jgi:hypothetical protein
VAVIVFHCPDQLASITSRTGQAMVACRQQRQLEKTIPPPEHAIKRGSTNVPSSVGGD